MHTNNNEKIIRRKALKDYNQVVLLAITYLRNSSIKSFRESSSWYVVVPSNVFQKNLNSIVWKLISLENISTVHPTNSVNFWKQMFLHPAPVNLIAFETKKSSIPKSSYHISFETWPSIWMMGNTLTIHRLFSSKLRRYRI